MRKALLNWIDSHDYNLFITITLRQSITSDAGHKVYIDDENVRKTAWILRDRILKSLKCESKKKVYLAFKECGSLCNKRYHLHIVTYKPDNMNIAEYENKFRSKANRLDWVYNEIDIREIRSGEARQVLSYSLKEGVKAFIPEASYF
jgi:hypothetical protein